MLYVVIHLFECILLSFNNDPLPFLWDGLKNIIAYDIYREQLYFHLQLMLRVLLNPTVKFQVLSPAAEWLWVFPVSAKICIASKLCRLSWFWMKDWTAIVVS